MYFHLSLGRVYDLSMHKSYDYYICICVLVIKYGGNKFCKYIAQGRHMEAYDTHKAKQKLFAFPVSAI